MKSCALKFMTAPDTQNTMILTSFTLLSYHSSTYV